jgi:hypothetical protein
MADKKRRTARSATTRASKPTTPSEHLIAERAYTLWQARGCPISDGREDWFAAQAELSGEAPRRSALRRLNA